MIPSNGTILNIGYSGPDKFRVNGRLVINGGKIHNTSRNPWQPTLLLDSADDVLECNGVEFTGESFESNGKWSANRNIEVNGGGKLILRECTFTGGDSILARRGNVEITHCSWLGTTFGYNVYLGDCNTNPADVVSGLISNCAFRASRREASVRAMGFSGTIRECFFDYENTPSNNLHTKEWLQLRHGRVVVEDCILMPVSVGPLKYDDPGDGGRSFAYAQTKPTFVYFDRCKIRGPIRVQGHGNVALLNVESKGRDPRGGDENCLVKGAAWKSPSGLTQRPSCALRDCVIPAGMTLVTGTIDEGDFEAIRREAGYVPPVEQPENMVVTVPKNVRTVTLNIER